MNSAILQPVVTLVAWTVIMMFWLFLVRLPALRKAGIDLSKAQGSRPGLLDTLLPPNAQWPAHNYIHLMEQPTIFYAVCFALALMGQGDGLNAQIAWVYVVLRILHSVVQATINRIAIRFALFVLSSLALTMLSVHAV